MRDNMWVKRLNSEGDFFRYEVQKCNSIEMMNEDESITTAFVLYKYWRNNNDEFKMCSSNYKMVVSLETLMSKFVEVDSELDKEITELKEFKHKVEEEKMDAYLSRFYVGGNDVVCTSENETVTNLDVKLTDPVSDGKH